MRGKKTPENEGWTWLSNSRKWHYFVRGVSLCGRFMLARNPELVYGSDDSPDNCAKCRMMKIKRKVKE